MAEINGKFDEKFALVAETLSQSLDRGADIGASAAVFIDGEPVVDIWGGYLDEAKTTPWKEDTIVNNFSTTKTMTALCMLILVDRGVVDPDAPVAKYWPEFAQNGKAGVLVRHLLGHTSGLPGWTQPVTLEDILDREKAARLLAEQAPWWEPGMDVGYHAITFGPLLGEIILRVTGKTLKQFFAEEVAGPLGADYHIGAEPEHDHRVTPMIASTPIRPRAGEGTITDRVFFNPYVTPQFSGTIAWRRGEIGGSNGHGNARSVALVQSVLACGGEVNGVRLLSEEGCRRVLEVQADKVDLVAEFPMTWGMGYGLNNPMVSELFGNCFTGRTMAFWGGSGGSIAFNDLDARMTVAFVMNKHVEGSFDQRSVLAAVPSWGTRGPFEATKQQCARVNLDDWKRQVPVFLLAGERDALIPLEDMRELYARLPGPKRFGMLKDASHFHWAEGAEGLYNRCKELWENGTLPGADIEALTRNSPPFSELSQNRHGTDTLRVLCLAHFDEHLKGSLEAKAFLDDGLAGAFAARGIDLEVA